MVQLTTLRMLTLFGNSIEGDLPPRLPDRIESFNVYNNVIGGTVPPSYGSLTNLRALIVGHNRLTSSLPDTLMALSRLDVLAVDDNMLTGSILPLVSALPRLRHAFLEDNGFADRLDDVALAGPSRLKDLDVSDNFLVGQIPPDLFRHPTLEVIDLHGNHLSGAIPSFAERNDVLTFLALHENHLSGQIPDTIEHLASLKHLDVTSTRSTGTLPIESLGRMTNLEYMFLANNPFEEGPIPREDEWSHLTKLRDLSLKKTRRTGTIPSYLATAMTDLVLLDLDLNALTGPLPPELGNSTIVFLQLQRNRLGGTIPSEWGAFSSLAFLSIENNTVAGSAAHLCRGIGRVGDFRMIADCGGANPEVVECACCTTCCDDHRRGHPSPCHEGDALAQYDPVWENGHARPNEYVLRNDLNISSSLDDDEDDDHGR